MNGYPVILNPEGTSRPIAFGSAGTICQVSDGEVVKAPLKHNFEGRNCALIAKKLSTTPCLNTQIISTASPLQNRVFDSRSCGWGTFVIICKAITINLTATFGTNGSPVLPAPLPSFTLMVLSMLISASGISSWLMTYPLNSATFPARKSVTLNHSWRKRIGIGCRHGLHSLK